MNILVDFALIGLLIYAALAGAKRGLIMLGLELVTFVIATAVAFAAYQPLGGVVKDLTALSAPLSNVASFSILWAITEIIGAIIIRLTLLRHLHRQAQLSRPNQIGGAVLGAAKWAVIILLGLIVFAGLPLSSGTKRFVTDAHIPKLLLASSGRLQTWLGSGLGHDLGESLNFFTVTAEPESQQRIDLGYTTTGTADPRDEDAMLVLLNEERISRGLRALTMNEKARAVARNYSIDMFARGYFSHINPEGKSPFDRMKADGVKFGAAGENLALAPTLHLAHQGLMNSPGHRANILSENYRTAGIGIIDGGPYGLMVTQDFTD